MCSCPLWPLKHTVRPPPVVSPACHSFWTLAEPYTLEVEIKKSRFIASAWPVKTAAEVSRCLWGPVTHSSSLAILDP